MSSRVLGVNGGSVCSKENNVVVVEMNTNGFYNVEVIINQSKLNFKLCPHPNEPCRDLICFNSFYNRDCESISAMFNVFLAGI
jgi:hypothetical protein